MSTLLSAKSHGIFSPFCQSNSSSSTIFFHNSPGCAPCPPVKRRWGDESFLREKAKPRGRRGAEMCLSSFVPRRSCLPLTREVASPKGLTEGEIRRAYCKAGCAEHAGCKFSPSVACGDSSLVRGSQGAEMCPQAGRSEEAKPCEGQKAQRAVLPLLTG